MHVKNLSYSEHYFVIVITESVSMNGLLKVQKLKQKMTIKYSKRFFLIELVVTDCSLRKVCQNTCSPLPLYPCISAEL